MSTSTVIQAAAAVYGVVPGNAFVTAVNQELATVFGGDENALLNHYYQAVFTWNPATSAYDGEGGVTTQQIAEAMAINMGFTGEARTTEAARLAGELESVGIEVRGAKTKELIDAFEAGGTELATAFTALKNTVITSVADPSYTGISVTLSELGGFASLKPANITLGTTDAINEVALAAGAATTTGTAGIDIISGVVSSLSAERTLDAADSIDGGEGSNDTLQLTMKSSHSGFTSGTGGMKGVESLVLTNDSIINREFNATGVEGLANVTLNSSKGSLSLAALPEAGLSVRLNDQASGDLAIGFTATKVTGSSDSLNVTVSGVGSSSNAVRVQSDAIESLSISSIGTKQNYISMGTVSDDLKTVTVTGSTDFTLTREGTTATGAAPQTVDASDSTGKFTYTLAATTGAASLTSVVGSQGGSTITLAETAGTSQLATLAGGSKDDVFNVGASLLSTAAQINGGDGTDTLQLTSGATRTLQPEMSSIEIIKVGSSALTGAITLDAKNSSGLTTLEVGAAVAAFTLTNSKDADLAVNLTGTTSDITGGHLISSDHVGSTTASVSFTADTVKSNNLGLTLTKTTDFTLDVSAGALYLGDISVAASKSVSLKSAANTATKGSGIGSGVGDGTDDVKVTAAVAEVITIDSKGSLNVELDAAKATSMVVTHSAGVATAARVDGSTTMPLLEQLTLTSNSALTLAGTFPKLQIANISSSELVLTLPDLPNIVSGTISGTGTTTAKKSQLVFSGDIGGTGTTDSDSIDLTFSGFADGTSTSATAPAVDSRGSIDLKLSGLTSGVTTGDDPFVLGAVSSSLSSVSLSVNGASKPKVTVGAITAKTTANVDVTSLGQDFGASGATKSVTGETSVSFKGPSTFASYVTINANTVTVNGGAKPDVFEVKGTGSTATKLIVTGSLGFADGGLDDVIYVSTAVSTTKEVDLSGLTGQTGGSYVIYGMSYANGTEALVANNAVTSIKGSATRDFIVASSATDGVTISGGSGADVFFIPNTASTQSTANDTGSATHTLANPVVITDFSSGDIVDFGDSGGLIPVFARGAYDSASKVFTNSATPTGASATGADTLVYITGQAVVLSGYAATTSNTSTTAGTVVDVTVVGGTGGTTIQAALAVTGLLGVA